MKKLTIGLVLVTSVVAPATARFAIPPQSERTATWYSAHPLAMKLALLACRNGPGHTASSAPSCSGSDGGGGTSPSGTIATPGFGTITDASGNTYTLTQTEVMMEGTNAVSGGAGFSELEYYNDELYVEDARTGAWYTFFNGTFTPSASPGPTNYTRVGAPLSGTVTAGTWTAVDYSPKGVALASGKQFHFEYLLPANYKSSYVYPVLIWLHSDFEGDPWYNGSDTDPNQISTSDDPGLNPNAMYNSVSFRTNYPAIIVVPYADQTNAGSGDGNDAVENWGGWVNNSTMGSATNYSGDTGPNDFALVDLVQNWLPQHLSVDKSRVYVSGFSLGGIGAHYLMQTYNEVNGNPKLFTSAIDIAGVLEIDGDGAGPTAAQGAAMTNVPVWWVSGAQDNQSYSAHWNEPMWTALAGNSSYPAPNSTIAVSTAGPTQYHYWEDPNIGHQQTDSNGNNYMANTTLLGWLFQQIGDVTP